MNKVNMFWLGGYNNYFNRIIKKLSTIDEYKTAVGDNYRVHPQIDFNPNDGVETTVICDWRDMINASPKLYDDIDWIPDYLVISTTQVVGLTYREKIESRWFVMEFKRTRGGQYSVTLKRDVIADHLNELLSCPMYIEKGTINNNTSKLLYNSENFSCNQIKKGEVLLKDKTQCPWLVLYMNKGYINGLGSSTTFNMANPDYASQIYRTIETDIDDWEYNDKTFICSDTLGYIFRYAYSLDLRPGAPAEACTIGDDLTKGNIWEQLDIVYRGLMLNGYPPFANEVFDNLKTTIHSRKATLRSLAKSAYTSLKDISSLNNYTQYNGKLVQANDGVYRITVKTTQVTEYKFVDQNVSEPLASALLNIWSSTYPDAYRSESAPFNFGFVAVNAIKVEFSKERVNAFSATGTLNPATILRTESNLFDALCVPFADKDWGGGGYNFSTKEEFKSAIESIIKTVGTANILDYQLLPYCPVPEAISYTGDFIDGAANTYIDFIDDGASISRVWMVRNVNFTFNINETIEINNNESNTSTVIKQKWLNDCTILRLCSPNYNGVFEFNIAKNGSVNSFNVDVTLKPYNPYIHVNPLFGNLYGQDFDDNRGLICQGDFSLGLDNDPWKNYQVQNKTYQQMFNREIESLDLRQQIQRTEAAFGLTAGMVGAGSAGALAGAKAGGPYGAIAGAAIGLTAGGLGGAIDAANLGTIQKDTRDLTIDKFNMSLQNIKALPHSLTKGDPLTANYKWFPFVEIYTCSDEETSAYYKKIQYDGMTVGIIDILSNWTNLDYTRYVKAQLVRNTSIKDDTHMLNEINLELGKGIYL